MSAKKNDQKKPLVSRLKINKRSAAAVFFAVAVVLLLIAPLVRPIAASGPSSNRILNYQLRLTNSLGVAVPDGTKNLKLTIYDSSSGGIQLYTACSSDGSALGTPTAAVATFDGGTSSILLGDTAIGCASGTAVAIPATLFNTAAVWLGVTVEADAEMTPRKRIVAAGYALNSDRLDDLETSAVGGSNAFVPVTDSTGNFTLTKNVTFDATTFFLDASADHIGIGTTSPDGLLTVGAPMTAQGSAIAPVGDLSVNKTLTAFGRAATVQALWDFTSSGFGITALEVFGQTKAGNANNMTGTLSGIIGRAEHLGSGTATSMTGVLGVGGGRSSGSVTTAIGVSGSGLSNTGSIVTTAIGVKGTVSISSGSIASGYAMYASNASGAGVGSITKSVGLAVEEITGSTNNTDVLIGTATAAAGNFAIYNASARDNYFAGNVGIGIASPSAKLDVAGTVKLGAATTDTLTFNGYVGSDFIPTSDNLYDLGSSAFRWRDLYLGPASLHMGAVGDEAKITYNTVSNRLEFDSNGDGLADSYIDGSGNLTTTGTVTSTSTGTTALSGGLTTAGNATFGDASTDATTVNGTLTLNGSVTAEPSGANGMMYYNTVSDKFRCYQGGAWTDCIGSGGAMAIGGTVSGATAGSALFAGAASALTQDNDNFFWNDTDNRLGIGTNNPLTKLHVNGGAVRISSASNGYWWFESDASGAFLENDGNNTSNENIRIQSSTSGDSTNYSQFFVDPTSGFAFMKTGTGNGNVGIGTQSPLNMLDVEGGAVIGAAYSGTSAAPTNGLLVEGNVGIGTTSPGVRLQLHAASGSSPGLRFSDGDVTHGMTSLSPTDVAGFIGLWGGNNGGLAFTGYSDSDATAFGFEGYTGATSPTVPVVIFRSGKKNGTTSQILADSEIHTQWQKSDTTPLMTLLGGGSVGIGTTTPASKLDIVLDNNTGLRLTDNTTDAVNKDSIILGRPYTNAEEDVLLFWGQQQAEGNGNIVNYGGGSGLYNTATELRFFTAANTTTLTGSRRMTIDASGNVGIGTTTPTSFMLQVAGGVGPDADNLFDLGSTSKRWKTLHVGPGSIVVNNDITDTLKATLGFSGSTAQLVTDAATPLKLTTGANIGLNMDTSGNVGIGTTIPAGRLHLVDGNFLVSGTTSTNGIDSNAKLVLHANGTGNMFVDSSPSSKTVTANGDVTQSSVQSVFGGKSAFFDGAGDTLSLIDNADWDYGSGDFTIDFWFRASSVSAGSHILYVQGNFGNYAPVNLLRNGSSLQLYMSTTGSSWDLANGVSVGTIAADTWYHFALSRSGTNIRYFLNGTPVSTIVSSAALYDSPDPLYLGGANSGQNWDGYMDEIRLSKGIARWTAGFTPPIIEYSAGAGSAIGIGLSGTPPLSLLDVNGPVAIGSYAGTIAAPANGLIVSGNVGIGTTTPLTKLDLAGNLRTTGKATAVLTGSIDPAASTTVTGVGTLFTTQLVVGDRITVTGETRTVMVIASATSLTVDTAFSNNANDTSPDVLYAIATMRDSSNAVKFAVNDLGNVGIGTTSPILSLHIVKDHTGASTAGLEFDAYRSDGGNAPRPVLQMASARGTPAAPADVGTGDGLGEFIGNGYAGGAFRTVASMEMKVDAGTISATSLPSRISFSTTPNGSISRLERMRIDLAGNVGIGDTAPDSLLDILSSGAANTTLKIANTNAGDFDPVIGFELAEGTHTFSMGVDDSDSDKFKIGTTAIETNTRLTIDSSGNVGIGDATPDFLLKVQKDQNSSTYAAVENATSGTAAVAGLYAKNNNNAGVALQAFSSGYTTSGINIANYGVVGTDSALGGLAIGTAGAGDPLVFGTANIERMRIDGSGNVGIGTASPSYRLDVFAPAQASTQESLSRWRVSDDADAFVEVFNGTTTDGLFAPSIRARAPNNAARPGLIYQSEILTAFDSGTTPITLFDSSRSDGVAVTRPLFSFESFGTKYMTVAAGGNVGIGTASPAAGLDVAGTVALGSATADTLTFTGYVGSHFIPTTDDTHDLGSSTFRWRDLYLGPASIHLGGIGEESKISYNTVSNRLEFDANGDSVPDAYVDGSGNLTATGTVTSTSTGTTALSGSLTTAGNSTLGDASTDATTVNGTFALNGSMIADPSGANGMMYYNTTSNKFRCYQGGAWTDCIGAGGSLAIGNSVTGATAGSVLFAGSGSVLAQDNAALFYDSSNDRLGIGTASPSEALSVNGALAMAETLTVPSATVGYSKVWSQIASSGGVDPQTTALLHMDGTNGATLFLDSALTPHSMTTLGGAQISTAQSKFNGASGSFNGTNACIQSSSPADYTMGTGDFTIDAWVRLNAMPTSDAWPTNFTNHFEVMGMGSTGAGDGYAVLIGQTKLILHSNDTQIVNGTHSMTTNTWYHIAAVRSGNTFTLYVNGTQVGTATSAVTMGTGSNVYVGCETNQGAWLNGYIDELRVSKGIARWTSGFTPPSAPYQNGGFFKKDSAGNVTNLTLWTTSGMNALYSDGGVLVPSGNVGIGTTTAANTLTIGVDGSASAPAISLGTTADGNTGLFHPATDVMAVTTAGTERLRVDASGNVGIGTTSSFAGQLHINKAAAGALGGDLWITNTAATTVGSISRLAFSSDNTTDAIPGIGLEGTLMNVGSFLMDLVFKTWNGGSYGERMRLTSGGSVGIGTSSPASLLSVNGGISVGTYSGTTAAPSNGMIVSGAVGIGTSNPFAGQLAVSAVSAGGLGGDLWINNMGASTVGSYSRLAFSPDNTTDGNPTAGIENIITTVSGSHSDLAFKLWNGSTYGEKMRIMDSGNVGIGTTIPSYQLHAYNPATNAVSNTIAVENKVTTLNSYYLAINDSGKRMFMGSYGSAVATAGYPNNAAFGAENSLLVVSDAYVTSGGANKISFLTGGYVAATQTRMTIDSTGNVGIGTAGPDDKLEVVAGTLTDGQQSFSVTSTLPTVPTATAIANDIQVTSAGSAAFSQYGLRSKLSAGYTGDKDTTALFFDNAALSTGAFDPIANITSVGANHGAYGFVTGAGAGTKIAVRGLARNGTGINTAVFGAADQPGAGSTNYGVIGNATATGGTNNIGVAGFGLNTTAIGGYFGLQNATPTYVSAALIADNGAVAAPIFLGRDNGSTVFSIIDGGNVGIGTASPLTRLDLAGNLRTTGKATAVLTGSIDPAFSSTTVTGVGTLFTTELAVGDRIVVSGETRTVTAIASNTSLSIDWSFTDNGNDTSPDALYALASFRTNAGATSVVINDDGLLNGETINFIFPEAYGITTARNYRIATLPVSTTDTYDHVIIESLSGGWVSTQKLLIKALFGNRSGFNYSWTQQGTAPTGAESGCGSLRAYNNSGVTEIYLFYPGNSSWCGGSSVSVKLPRQATAIGTPTDVGATPTGTLIFDTNSASYPPTMTGLMNGNVGVGTAAPVDSDKFSVYTSGSTTTSKVAGFFQNTKDNTTTDGINRFGVYSETGLAFTGSAGAATGSYNFYANKAASGADNNFAYYANLPLTSSGQNNYMFYGTGSAASGATLYGAYVDVGTGSGTEYAAAFLNGNVGIGTATPNKTLDVQGAVEINLPGTGTANALCHTSQIGTTDEEIVDCTGAPVADYAENYPTAPDVLPGDIVALGEKVVTTTDGDTLREFGKATTPYARGVLGIVSDPTKSTDFNVIGYNIKYEDRPMPIALNGRVSALVSIENGSIQPGDPITVSAAIPGAGMKATQPGMIVGFALDSFTSTESAKILVFVNPGWWNGSDLLDNNSSSGVTRLSELTVDGDADLMGYSLLNVGAIEGLGGLWRIDSSGRLMAKEVTTDHLNTKTVSVTKTDSKNAISRATILAGMTAVVVTNPEVKATSEIFVTFKKNPGSMWWIDETHDGVFIVRTAQPVPEDVAFSYWIIDVIDETTPPPSPDVPLAPTPPSDTNLPLDSATNDTIPPATDEPVTGDGSVTSSGDVTPDTTTPSDQDATADTITP